MPSHTITIDLVNEITQAEFCRRTGESLANLSPKLKKMSVREIPELGMKLINISAPSFDTIRIEAPPVREYSIGELSGLFGNLLAQYQTNEQNKDARISSLERVIEELSQKLELMGEELELQKQLNDQLQADAQAGEEMVKAKEAHIEELTQEHQQAMEHLHSEHSRITRENDHRVEVANTDLKVANFSLEEKEKALQALKSDYGKLQAEREMLQSRLLDLGNKPVATSITEELQSFKNEFLSLFQSFQSSNPVQKANVTDTPAPLATSGKTKAKVSKPGEKNGSGKKKGS